MIPKGPLSFQHTMDETLRKLGLPVMLKNQIVMCEADHKVCSKGQPLTPEQAQVFVCVCCVCVLCVCVVCVRVRVHVRERSTCSPVRALVRMRLCA